MKKGVFAAKRPMVAQELPDFAIAVKSAREKANLSQTALAEAVGLHRANISAIENGKLGMRLHKLVELCRILKTTPNKLLGFE